jgi:transcription termination factor NusB
MEQDKIESRDEATAVEKAADQNRRKRLLKKIIEYYMESVNNSLSVFERHMNFFADEDEDFEDREEIMEDLAKSVQAHCDKISAILDSHKWKGEQEADWHFNPWEHFHFVVFH